MNNEIEFKFGDYAIIEQKRHGAPNEMYVYKVIGQLRSNKWVDVPVWGVATEILHKELDDVCLCIRCGIDETVVHQYRVKDMQRSSRSPDGGEVTALALTLEKSREAAGCPAGVDLQDWVKQLAAERDAALNAEHVWETAMMEVCGEDGPASVANEIRSLRDLRDTAIQALKSQVERLAAENAYLLNGAARELNTSWMFSKTMLGAQAALVCLAHGYQAAAREWLEGTTDEAVADIPDDITVGELHEWFESQMVSNDGKSGFLTRAEAEEAIRKTCSATDRIVAGIKADGATAAGDYLKLNAQHMSDDERLRMQDAAEICYGTAARLREGADK